MTEEPRKVRYEDLVELARACAYQARITKDKDVANEFRCMAKEYQQRAADIDGGKFPDIGEP